MTPEESFGIRSIEIGIVLGALMAAFLDCSLGEGFGAVVISSILSFWIGMRVEKYIFTHREKWSKNHMKKSIELRRSIDN